MSSIAIVRWRELDTWTPVYAESTANIWPLVAVKDVLTPSAVQFERPESDEAVRLAGVRWYGDGLFIRETRAGSDLNARCFPLVPGNLVYNRLFAWKSAFALVSEDYEDAKVSIEFPQFEINLERVLPQFIQLVCASGPFAQQILTRSSGSTAVSRNRLLESEFLRLSLPLPPLSEQLRLTSEYNLLRSEADTLYSSGVTRQIKAWQQFEERLGFAPTIPVAGAGKVSVSWFIDLNRWDADTPSCDAASSGHWKALALATQADMRLGTQLTRRGTTQGTSHPYLRAANIRRGYVDLSDIKYMNAADSMAATLALADGDLLFVEGNSREEVGRCAVWVGDPQDYIYQNSVIRARIVADDLDARFACAWFNSRPGRRYFEEYSTTTTGTLWHIGAGKTADAPIPIPPKSIQEEMAANLWNEVNAARLEQERSFETRLLAETTFNIGAFGKDVPRQ